MSYITHYYSLDLGCCADWIIIDLPYRNFLQPYAAWATLFMVVMILIFSGMLARQFLV
jgi:amino acid permease